MAEIALKSTGGYLFSLGGETKLRYNELLKQLLMMAIKNNVAMRELNDNINHENVVIILISFMFVDVVEYFY